MLPQGCKVYKVALTNYFGKRRGSALLWAIPSNGEIAEAKRQKEEVKVKWTNPDGSMKRGYMLAPNGKPTKLTEEQWLSVRTPNFKRWFGDWETLAEYEFLNGEPIINITLSDLNSKAIERESVLSYWDNKYSDKKNGKNFDKSRPALDEVTPFYGSKEPPHVRNGYVAWWRLAEFELFYYQGPA